MAKDFAAALGCRFSPAEKCYRSSDGKTTIANCVGHLFNLAEPAAYSPSFKSWKNLPVIPEEFIYEPSASLKDVARRVTALLKKHRNDEILIATDADREGEIIARECLTAAGITDFAKIRRFWVSQALTKDVITDGIKNAKPLSDYDSLAEQGVARQKADWIIGMNATRYATNIANRLLPVGRVQTAILAEIAERCKEIKNFKSEKYYEAEGIFEIQDSGKTFSALLTRNGKSKFSEKTEVQNLDSLTSHTASVTDIKREKRTANPPQLYNLNDLQKDAFSYFGLTAEKTLAVVQTLYENYKCVSYPRTPSKVMGSDNVGLCGSLHEKMLRAYPEYFALHSVCKIDGTEKRVFDDSKLEAHHALIPLAELPPNATGDEENIFSLILERFMLAFAPTSETESITVTLAVSDASFVAKGTRTVSGGWKDYRRFTKSLGQKQEKEDSQELDGIDSAEIILKSISAKEKFTKPPKHYNEASLLSFMENPKNSDNQKLAGLGTAATRHTFIPKLKKSGFIGEEKKNLVATKTGEELLGLLSKTPFKTLADTAETTRWETELSENPAAFLSEIKAFTKKAAAGGSE